MPRVSVVMPAYNAEKYIGEAIESILNQTFADFELIIIDDGSSDNTKNTIMRYTDPRICFYQNEHNMGVAATLNRGLELATGEYIARMDSDDISLAERFEKQVIFMDRHPDVAVAGTGIQLFGAQSATQMFSADYDHLKVDLLFSNCFAHPSVMLRAKFFQKTGLCYDTAYSRMEDFDLWVRTAEQYKIASLQEVLLKYRIHPNQVTQKPSEDIIIQLRNLKKRQIANLGIETSGEGFEQYLQYCLGNFNATEENIMLLAAFFASLRKANKRKQDYEEAILQGVCNSIITGQLSRIPLLYAIEIAQKCNLNGAKYGVQRVARGMITRVGGVIEQKKRNSKLESKDFSIISNNCWGGLIYQKYGLKYASPTVGLYILGHDFVKLCAKWNWYMEQKLQFIPWEEATYYDAIKDSNPYPVAKLEDIEIYFMHYYSEHEASEKWYRRVKRINPNHMIFKLSQREECSKADVEAFMKLPLAHKVCFAYEPVPGTVHIPELEGLVGDETEIINQYYNDLDILNEP